MVRVLCVFSASSTASGPFTSQDLIGSYSSDPLRLSSGGGGQNNEDPLRSGNLTDREVVRWKNNNSQQQQQQPTPRPPSQNKEQRQISLTGKGKRTLLFHFILFK